MKWMVMLPRVVATLAVVTLAAGAGWHLWDYYLNEPWTRDGKVRSDVTTLAVDEAGLIRTVHVHDNQLVHKGDLLVELDEHYDPRNFIALLRGLNGLEHHIPQAEGVALDEAGNLYLVSERNLFYVFRKVAAQ